jgi:hypothetical protein
LTEEEATSRAQNQKGVMGPACNGRCYVGGEKSYNEMRKMFNMPPKTYFRVWLMQQVPPSRELEREWCANY